VHVFFFCLAFQFYVNVTKAKERIIFVAYIIHGLSGFFDTMKYRNFVVQREPPEQLRYRWNVQGGTAELGSDLILVLEKGQIP
jgi:hypothetical protein